VALPSPHLARHTLFATAYEGGCTHSDGRQRSERCRGSLGRSGTSDRCLRMPSQSATGRKHITFKELHAVVHAVELFGRGARWEDREIVINTDNTEVAAAVQTGYIKHVASQSLLRRLWLSAAAGRFRISTIWLPSNDNGLADALSRFDWIKAQDIDPIAWRALQRRQSRNLSSVHPLPPQDRSRYFPPRRLVPNPTVAVSNHPRKASWTLSSSIATRHNTFGSASEREFAQPTTRRRRLSRSGLRDRGSSLSQLPHQRSAGGRVVWRQTVSGPVLFAAPLRDSASSTPTPVSTTQRSTLRSWEGSYGESAATQAPLSGASASPSLSLYSRPSRPRSVHSQASPTATGSPCRRHMLLHKSERSDRELTYGSGDFDPSFCCSRSDVRDCGDYALVRLPSSESDPYRKGVDIIIPSAPPNALVDPLALLRHHLRFNPGERNSPLFARAGSYPAAFQKGWSVDSLRRSITAAGIEAKHFGHSFRRGLCYMGKAVGKPWRRRHPPPWSVVLKRRPSLPRVNARTACRHLTGYAYGQPVGPYRHSPASGLLVGGRVTHPSTSSSRNRSALLGLWLGLRTRTGCAVCMHHVPGARTRRCSITVASQQRV